MRSLVAAFLLPVYFFSSLNIGYAAPPDWWFTGSPPVIDVSAAINNLGPANIGQAKWMARSAVEALKAVDPATGALVEEDLVGTGKPLASWAAPVTPEEIQAQKAPLLIGQLKALAAPFYDRIHAAAPDWLESQRQENLMDFVASIYPWSATTLDDSNRSIATIGQLKAVFSLDFATLDVIDPPTVPGALGRSIRITGAWQVGVRESSGANASGADVLFEVVQGDHDFFGSSSRVVATGSNGLANVPSDPGLTTGVVIRASIQKNLGRQSVYLTEAIPGWTSTSGSGGGNFTPGLFDNKPPPADPGGPSEEDLRIGWVSTWTEYGTYSCPSATPSTLTEPKEVTVTLTVHAPDGEEEEEAPEPPELDNNFVHEVSSFTLESEEGDPCSVLNQKRPTEEDGGGPGGMMIYDEDWKPKFKAECCHDILEFAVAHPQVAFTNYDLGEDRSGKTRIVGADGRFLTILGEEFDDRLYESTCRPISQQVWRLVLSDPDKVKMKYKQLGGDESELVEIASGGEIPVGAATYMAEGFDLFVEFTAGSGEGVTLTIEKDLPDGEGGFVTMDTYVNLVYPGELSPRPAAVVSIDEAAPATYRKIGLTGVPLADSKPQAAEESDLETEETYVDALTLDLVHQHTDIHMPVPASDLVLSVRRNASPEIWTKHYGLKPGEQPCKPFGAGWESNLCSYVEFGEQVTSTGQLVAKMSRAAREVAKVAQGSPNTATVVDENGMAYQFFVDYNAASLDGRPRTFKPLPGARHQQASYTVTLVEEIGGDLVFRRKFGTELRFNTPVVVGNAAGVSNEREYGSYQNTLMTFHRLSKVRDRYGVEVNYTYGGISLIPNLIAVAGRPDLKISILHDSNGRVTDVWDATGRKTHYNYTTTGSTTGGVSILSSAQSLDAGNLEIKKVSYQYSEFEEPDHRLVDAPTLLPKVPGTETRYSIKTYHVNLSGITDSYGRTTTFTLGADLSREVTEQTMDTGGTYTVAGVPRNVTAISLPGPRTVSIGGIHQVKFTGVSGSAVSTRRETTVTDASGAKHFYEWPASEKVVELLPSSVAGYEFSETIKVPLQVGYKQMTLSHAPAGTSDFAGVETFDFSKETGYAVTQVMDFSNNVTIFEYEDSAPGGGYWNDPTEQKNALLHTKSFTYGGSYRTMTSVTDEENRRTEYALGSWDRRTAEIRKDALGRIVQWKKFDYHGSWPAFVSRERLIRKADEPSPSGMVWSPAVVDPPWVSTLATLREPDTLGRVGREAVDMNGNGVIDAGDLVTTYTYEANGNKTSVTDPAGMTTWFRYDALNRLVETTFADGTRKTFTYDRLSRKVGEADEAGRTTASVYDNRGFLTEIIQDGDANATFNDAGGTWSGIADAADIGVSFEYNGVGSRTLATDERDFSTATVYDHLQRPKTITGPWQVGSPITELGYDSERNCGGSVFDASSFKPTWVKDARNFQTFTTYDDLYRPVDIRAEQATGLFRVEKRTYDEVGNPETVETYRSAVGVSVNPSGISLRTRTVYDALNRPVETYKADGTAKQAKTVTAYTPTGLARHTATELTAGVFAETDMEYDAAGRLVKTILPEMHDASGDNATVRPELLQAYNAAGDVISKTDGRGQVWSYYHDARHRPIAELAPAVANGVTGNSRHPLTVTVYDRMGNVIQVVGPRGDITRTFYDAHHRPWKTAVNPATGLPSTDPGTPETPTYPAGDLVTITSYDKAGNVVAVEDTNRNRTRNAYDALGRLTRTITDPVNAIPEDPGAPGFNPAAFQQLSSVAMLVTHEYDKTGNLISVKDGRGAVTSFTYDGFGRKTSTIWDPGKTAVRTESAAYDTLFQIERTDGLGRITRYTYDVAGQLFGTIYAPVGTTFGSSHADNTERTYDLAGRLRLVSYPNSPGSIREVEQTYDAHGRVMSERSAGATHTYGYDSNGNRVHTTYGRTGRHLEGTFDTLNRLSTLQLRDMAWGAPVGNSTTYSYDLAGSVVRKILPNETYTDTSYDFLGRTLTIVNCEPGGLALSAFDYSQPGSYDGVGNVLKIGESYPSGLLAGRVVTNTYDKTYRLATETTVTGGITSVTSYSYDAGNNRTSKIQSGVTITYVYGNGGGSYNSNQLVSHGLFTYTYDANGNRATRTAGAFTDTYTWDHENRLVSLARPSSTYLYTYDSRMRRVVRDESGAGGTFTALSFSGGTSVQEATSAGVVQGEFIRGSDWGGGVGGILYTIRGTSFSYNAYDSRGDVVSTSDGSGAALWQASYEAFGTRTEESGTNPERQRANTKEEDPTGLLNEGFRYRDLEAGCFISRDPLGFVDGPNVYAYVRQNPWTFYDPHGLESHGAVVDWAWNFGRGAGGVVVGGVTGVAKDVVNLPKNIVDITTSVYALAQHDGDVILSSAKEVGEESVQAIEEAAVDFGEKIASGDADAIGQATATVVVAVVARKYAKGKGVGKCFPAGTLVSTPDGAKPIEEIEEDDLVFAYDEKAREVVARKVTKTVHNFTYFWVDVNVGSEIISATRGHRFWVESENEWIEALSLEAGMTIREADGDIRKIVGVKLRDVEKPEGTFNFEVADHHNYFVGKSQVLVHNGDVDQEHRGRIQVQGDNIEASKSWAQPKPPTVSEGLKMVDDLENSVPKKEAKLRKKQFEQARTYVRNAGKAGGADAPVSKTYQVPNTKHERVDIEVRKGKAFVPDPPC